MASSSKSEGFPATLNDSSMTNQEPSKGSGMTKRGVYAAVSYMVSAGNTFFPFSFNFNVWTHFMEQILMLLFTLKVGLSNEIFL